MVEKTINKPNMVFQELLELLGKRVVPRLREFSAWPTWMLLSKTGPLLPISVLSTHFGL